MLSIYHLVSFTVGHWALLVYFVKDYLCARG